MQTKENYTPTGLEQEVFNLQIELGIEQVPEAEPFNPIEFIKEIQAKAQSLKDTVDMGFVNPIHVMMALSQCEKIFKSNSDAIKKEALKEFEKYTDKTLNLFGFQITRTAGATYSYKHSETWTALDYDKKDYELKMKTVQQCMSESKPAPAQLIGIELAERKESEQTLAFKPTK